MNKEDLILSVRFLSKQIEMVYNETPEQDKEDLVKNLKREVEKLRSSIFNIDSPNLILRFGKFKGQQIKDIPAWYLLWCYEQDWFKEHNKEIYEYIKSKIKNIKTRAKQESSDRNSEPDNVDTGEHDDCGDRD